MNILCKLFGHRFSYYIRNADPNQNIRACHRCGTVQEYKELSFLGNTEKVWMNLVQRTRNGAEKFFKEREIKLN